MRIGREKDDDATPVRLKACLPTAAIAVLEIDVTNHIFLTGAAAVAHWVAY